MRHLGSATELEQHAGGDTMVGTGLNPTLLFLKADFAPWAKSGLTSHSAAGLLHYPSVRMVSLSSWVIFVFLLCFKSKFLLFRFSQDSPYREAQERDSALS